MERIKRTWTYLIVEARSTIRDCIDEISSSPARYFVALFLLWMLLFLSASILCGILESTHTYAAGMGGSLPGDDATSNLTAAGTLLKILDTGLFKWGARIFAGLCIMSSAWALKEQRFGIAVICVVGAIIFGTAPKWVQNVFEIGGNQGVFSRLLNSEDPEPMRRVT